jgi:(2Fe-2S) ferredoxin
MHYAKHIFLCTNQKAEGRPCCANTGASVFFLHIKEKLRSLKLHGEGKIRISQSGCLGRCNEGPCLVIYPEAIWYTYATFADIDEIIESHLIEDKQVTRLLLS